VDGHEIELKAGLSAGDARRILRTLKADYGPGQQPEHLRSIYFDTPARHLKAHGIALRIRREGGRFIQTVKAGRTGVGGFQQVREFDNAVTGFKPRIAAITDRSMRETIENVTQATILAPQFETRVRRARWLVCEPHGEIEIALDQGWFDAAGTRAPILELEMELKGGSPEALFDLADRLLGDTHADLSVSSKATRGYALSAGEDILARPFAGKPKAQPGDKAAGAAFESILKSLAEAIAANLHATMASVDPEGPHQLRVALRRFRSALRLFADILDRKLARDLNATARDIGRSVSALRDSDVLTELVLGTAVAAADPLLPEALHEHREALRTAARSALRDGGATRFVLRLQRLVVLGGWQRKSARLAEPLSRFSARRLAERWKKIAEMGDRFSVLDEKDRHDFRKLLKEYRYMNDIIEVNKIINQDIKIIKKLLGALGALNDLSVLSAWKPGLASPDAEERLAGVRAALLTSSRHRGDLSLGRACRHWAELRLGAEG